MSAIEVYNLRKVFRKQTGRRFLIFPRYVPVIALDGISFSVGRKEIVGLLGPNGAGKTTTVRILSGILTPTQGEVKVLGKNPYEAREEVVRNIGVVFGHRPQLPLNLRAIDAVRVISMYYDVDEDSFEERFWRLAEEIGIEELVDRRVRQLSLGERMRFEIVASLIHDPKILILDEPTIGLDFPSKRKIREIIKKSGKTVLFTSHDALDIEEVCERVIILKKGKIVADTSVNKLRKLVGYKYAEIITERAAPVPPGWERKAENIVFGRIYSMDELLAVLDELREYGIIDVSVHYPSIEEILARIYEG